MKNMSAISKMLQIGWVQKDMNIPPAIGDEKVTA